jgi:ABC-type nitrate/sulfonate/bicarbonate transport system substrate-binding protein
VSKLSLLVTVAWAIVLARGACGRATTVPIGGASDAHISTDVKDATIFENNPDSSNGAGPGMFSGTDGSGLPLRGLIRFDVADNVPAGATIFNVQLELYLGKVAGSGGGGGPGGGTLTSTIGLHALSADWGEGTTGAGATTIGTTGQGFPANPGDATWNAAFYQQVSWTNAGGDFAATASAVATVGTTLNAASTWGSTPALVSDVQGWLNNPQTNFGWELVNTDETDSRTFRAFWTKEASDPTLRPELLVTYAVLPGDVTGDGIVNGLDINMIASHWLNTGSNTPGDANFDGVVNGLDINLIAAHWLQTTGGAGGSVGVPEPATIVSAMLGGLALLVYRRRHAFRPRLPGHFVGLCSLLLAWFVMPGATVQGAELRIIAPDSDNLQFMSFWVAKGAGYFADEGITLRMVLPEQPNQAQALVLEGEADCAVLPPPMYLELIAERFPWVLVANLLENDAINLVVRRSVAADRQVTSELPLKERLTKLAGLRIGVAPNPPTRLRALFAAEGLDADREIEMVILRGRDQNEAFSDGRVDALYCHTPFLEKALVDQDAVMIVNQSRGESPKLSVRQIHALAVSKRMASAEREKVTAMVRAIARAQRLIHRDQKGTTEALLREFPDMDRRHVETIVAIYEPAIPHTPRVSADGFKPALELFPATRKAPDLSGIDLQDFVAADFATAAIKSLETKPGGTTSSP